MPLALNCLVFRKATSIVVLAISSLSAQQKEMEEWNRESMSEVVANGLIDWQDSRSVQRHGS